MHLESLDRTKCYPTPMLNTWKIHQSHGKSKIKLNANFKWNFHSECMFLSSLSGREWKKLRKIVYQAKLP